jgi:tRNA(adenine34) deaminase
MNVESHEYYMQMALQQAQHAVEEGEVPTGCVIVDAGDYQRTQSTIIGKAYNQVETLSDATAHAEMLAITQAADAIDDWRLTDTILYVTKEPCVMCAGAIVLARVPMVVFGAIDAERGGMSKFNILSHPDLNHRCDSIGGVLEAPCQALLQDFFRERRDS